MTQWHCYVGGREYGPVDEATLRQWAQQGRLRANDYVWRAGMEHWQPAGQAWPDLFVGPPMVSALPTGGTLGTTPNAELMAQARGQLSGHWGGPIIVSLLIFLIHLVLSRGSHVGGLLGLLVAGPLELGGAIFYLSFARDGSGRVGMVFKGFEAFATALGAYLLKGLFILLWSLLLIIPGIIAWIAYSQTFYLLADNPRLGAMAAISASKRMMMGYKWKYAYLQARFLGWVLLGVLTFGIGFIWIVPYMQTSFARFYDDLRPPALSADESAPVS